MKKSLVIVAGLIVCLALVGTAYAIDRSSLESQTTEGLYDRNDPFDHAMEPGLMYHLERWRLYTNLSGYEGDVELYDDDYDDFDTNREAYLIGVSGKLGPGSVAVFYESQKNEYNWSDSRRFVNEDEDSRSQPPDYDPANPNYGGHNPDGSLRYPTTLANVNFREYREDEETEDNWYLGYGMDFDGISLGVSWAPEFYKWDGTVELNGVYIRDGDVIRDIPGIDSSWNGGWGNDTSSRDWGDNWEDMGWDRNGYGSDDNWPGNLNSIELNEGSFAYGLPNFSDPWHRAGRDLNRICDDFYEGENFQWHGFFYTSDPDDPQSWERWESDVQFHGDGEQEGTIHPITVQSHIRTIPNWDFLVGVGYADIQMDDHFDTVFSGWGTYQNNVGDYEDFSSAMTAHGVLDIDTEVDQWSILISPTYQVNDIVSVRLDLKYTDWDGDFDEGCSGTFSARGTATEVDGWDLTEPYETQVYTLDGMWNGAADGSIDAYRYSVEPRVYFDYDRVKFSLGIGYMRTNEEFDWNETRYYSYTESYADGDLDAFDSDDWKEQGKWTGRGTFEEEYDVTTWRFPVAAEWMVTDKLTFRAGAAYYRLDYDTEENSVEYIEENESGYRIDGYGNYDWIGEEELRTDPDDPGTTYDDDTHIQYASSEHDGTEDWTRYQLGLGWLFTENLQFDLMWSGKGNDGGVDMTDVFASITLAF